VEERIKVHEGSVRIIDLEILNRDVADFLREVVKSEREHVFAQAVEIGVYSLERARTSRDTEFVRRQIDALLARVEEAVGKIPEETEKAISKEIGADDSKTLAPVRRLVKEVAAVSEARLNEVRRLLSDEIDPAKESSTLGKALKTLRDLLDPKRTDSVQGSVGEAIRQVTGEGGILSQTIKKVVVEGVKPLSDEVNRLTKEFAVQKEVAEALERTTEKGAPYEDDVVVVLRDWVTAVGGEVHHVGRDNRAGDVLVKLNGGSVSQFLVVVEVRDRMTPQGRKRITDDLTAAMAERDANAGIYVSRTRDGLGKEIADWAEGECERGCFVACTHENLVIAMRFLVAQKRLAQLRARAPEVDAASIEAQLQRVRTSLDRVKTIKRSITAIHSNTSDIQTEAEAIRTEVRDCLLCIEDALRIVTARPEAVPSD